MAIRYGTARQEGLRGGAAGRRPFLRWHSAISQCRAAPRTHRSDTRGMSALRKVLAGTTVLTAVTALAALMDLDQALALPTDGTVVEGQAEIVYGPSSVTIRQGTERVVIDWQTFDIAGDESVSFIQPDQLAAALNRVLSGGPSQILGSLNANGQVFISNPAGVVFGPDAAVDVQSIVATSLDVMNRDFMDGRTDFGIAGDPTAVVENHGDIDASGLAALVGPGARNAGTIVADVVVIGGGEGFALDYYGDGLVNFAITNPTVTRPVDSEGNPVEALVVNDGTILADGGRVVLTADAAAGVIDTVINLDGVVQARSVESRNGQVAMVGGDDGTVTVAGTIDAVGDDAGETGGSVHVLGDTVDLADGAVVDVSGMAGGGTALIGGSPGGALAPAGEIAYLAPAVSGRSGTTIVLDAAYEADGFLPLADVVYVRVGAVAAADATDAGDGGTVVVWAEAEAYFHGGISARGGSNGGEGGFVEVSAPEVYVTGQVDTSAAEGGFGLFLIDPIEASICDDALAACGDDANEIGDSALVASLEAGNVQLLTSVEGTGAGDGEWTMESGADVTWGAATSLTLTADDGAGANTQDGLISVESGVTLIGANAGSRIVFQAGTVTLESDVDAGALSGTATIVDVLSDSGDIQDGVDFAAAGATVNVAAGSYGAFTIDVADLTVAGVGETTVVNAAGPAVTVAADGATVESMLLQGTGAAHEVGVLLDGTAAPDLTGIDIVDVDFSNLDDGIRSRGDIGVGAAADVTIRGIDDAAPAVIEDILDAAIDVGDVDSDAVYLVQDVIVRDGDGDGVATGDGGLRFGDIGGATIERADVGDVTGNGIEIGVMVGGFLRVLDSVVDAGGNGIAALGTITNGTVTITSSGGITAGVHGIFFAQPSFASAIVIAANEIDAGTTAGANGDGIHFADQSVGSAITIGGSATDDGNTITVGAAVSGGGTTHDGIYFGAELFGIDPILIANNTIDVLALGGNSSIAVGDMGIRFDGFVDLDREAPELRIVDNEISAGEGQEDRGIAFWDGIGGFSNVHILGNTIASGDDGIGLFDVEAFGVGDGAGIRQALRDDARLTIRDNAIGTADARVGLANGIDGNGIDFQGVVDSAVFSIIENTIFANMNAVEFDRTVTSTGGFAALGEMGLFGNGALDSLRENAVDFEAGLSDAFVQIVNNNLVAPHHGVDFAGDVINSWVEIRDNSVEAGLVGDLDSDAIRFAGAFSAISLAPNPLLLIDGNELAAARHGISFGGVVADATVEVFGNVIEAGLGGEPDGDGIHFADAVADSDIFIGDEPSDGNVIAVGKPVSGGGTMHDGVYFGGGLTGVETTILIANNTIDVLTLDGTSRISVGDMGIRFDGFVNLQSTSQEGLRIRDNEISAGDGKEDRGIAFWNGIGGDSQVAILGNTIASGDDGIGVFDPEAFGIGDGAGEARRAVRGNARLLIEANAIGTDVVRVGFANGEDGNGIDLQGVTDASQVRIVGNDVFARQNAIEFDRTVTIGFAADGASSVEITDNETLDALQENGIAFERGVSGARVLIANNNDGVVAAQHGIAFGAAISGAELEIRGNMIDAGNVAGLNGDGIHFAGQIIDSALFIGGGNVITVGAAEFGGGTTHDGIYFGGNLIGSPNVDKVILIFDNTIDVLTLGGASPVSVGDMGIRFDGFVDLGFSPSPVSAPDLLRILNNDISAGDGAEDRGIAYWNGIGGFSGVEIRGNTIASGDDGIGIFDVEAFGLGDGVGAEWGLRDRARIRIEDNEIGAAGARVGLANNADGNGIDIRGAADGSVFEIRSNSVFANLNAIEFDQAVTTRFGFKGGPATVIAGNHILDSLNEDGIAFTRGISGTPIGIWDNSVVAARDGISFGPVSTRSGLLISRNSVTAQRHGINFASEVSLARVDIGSNTITAGLDSRLDGDGIRFSSTVADSDISMGPGVTGNSLTVGAATAGGGTTHNGIYFGGDVTGHSRVGIEGLDIRILEAGANERTSDGDMGIRFDGLVDLDEGLAGPVEVGPTGLRIAFNFIRAGEGREDRGVAFWNGIGGESRVTILRNTIAAGDDGIGIFDVEAFGLGDGIGALQGVRDNARVSILDNAIGTASVPVGLANGGDGNGIDIQAVAGTAQVRIVENEIFASIDAIQFDQTVTTTFAGPGAGIEITDNPVLNALRGLEIAFVRGVSVTTTTLIQNNN